MRFSCLQIHCTKQIPSWVVKKLKTKVFHIHIVRMLKALELFLLEINQVLYLRKLCCRFLEWNFGKQWMNETPWESHLFQWTLQVNWFSTFSRKVHVRLDFPHSRNAVFHLVFSNYNFLTSVCIHTQFTLYICTLHFLTILHLVVSF